MECINALFLFSTILFLSFCTNSGVDVLRGKQTISDGNTIVSANNEFELGFFSPGSCTNRYVGIWFKKISYGTTVWVANRDAPLNNTSGILRIDNKAISLLDNASSTIIWSSNYSRFVNNPVAQLLDSGNFVFRDEEDGGTENFVWQSFDYPGDTVLPGMKSGADLLMGKKWYYSSWKSLDDPSPGSFEHRMDIHGFPQLILWKGSELHARTGPWVGNRFSGDPVPKSNTVYYNQFFLGQREIYYTFRLSNQSSSTPTTKLKLTSDGNIQRLIWNDQDQGWVTYLTLLVTDCEQYGFCGPYGICDSTSSPRCSCLRGFEPKIPEKWEAADWTDGCVRITPLECGHGDGFMKYSGVKLPDTRKSWYNLSMNLEECKRMLNSNLELPSIEFHRILVATSNFSSDNKVGEGGYGPVYKGLLEDGQQIAVKRLSENSRQGIDEFKNELSVIAKLQHRNLVSLLGYCIKDTERILIYEYMPYKSLDSYIFDNEISRMLDWPKLYNVINGVARGLLYLHQDSKLRIIHRDLKASNVLLDDEMNPKISDFGMARSFGGSQTEANTTRVVGTYGYMPPEYVIDGIFSMKSDIYSFGVLVLETVSRQRNRCFEHPDHSLNLLGHAWRCFNEEKLERMIAREILESSRKHEVFRVIQIGLLCVQEYPQDRPNMSSVVLMLNSNIPLPNPKKPGFFTERKHHIKKKSQTKPTLSSSINSSVTAVKPR